MSISKKEKLGFGDVLCHSSGIDNVHCMVTLPMDMHSMRESLSPVHMNIMEKEPSFAVKQQQNLAAHFNVHNNWHVNPLDTSCMYCYEMDNETMGPSKKQQTEFRNMFCDSSYTHDGGKYCEFIAPFNIRDNCGNQPSDISCSAMTTFVPTRLQELHFKYASTIRIK
ncbi:hypothetical protein Tco_1007151 [Tanacetum coccineum]